MLAIDESDLILFLCEVETGITDYDAEIADILRRSGKNVILVVNKVDTGDKMYGAHEFNALGLGEPFCIASASGSGTGDLLDEVLKRLPDETGRKEEEKKLPHIAVVGRPNVGKSSLANALLGNDRNIVTPVAGTTRDAVSSHYNKFGFEFILVDTAGLRKKNKVKEDIEFYSVLRSVRTIEEADVCILMLDAQNGIESQDMNIFNLILKNKKGCVIVVNKWDTIEKDNNTMEKFKSAITGRIAPFTDVPIIFTSVINKQRIHDVLAAAEKTYANISKRIPTSKLNEIMLAEIENFPPPSIKGKYIRIKYATQLSSPTPTFAFFCNLPQYIRDDYKRFLENKLRQHFDFKGVPIQIFFRQK